MSTDCQSDYKEAQQRIRMAHESGASEVSLADLALERLPDELGDLTELTTLRVDGCLELKDISILRFCTRLTILDLRKCPRLIDLSPLRGLHALRELYIGIRDLGDVGQGKKPLSTLCDINALTDLALEILTLGGCDSVSCFQSLSTLTALQTLDLSRCEQLHDLRPLAALIALQSLDLSGCEQLQDLRPLSTLTTLQSLDLSGCEQLQDLWPLSTLTTLQSLDLSWCQQLQNLRWMADLTTLRHLNLSNCEQLQDLWPPSSLSNLQRLDLSGCKNVHDLRPLAVLTALQNLDLSGCDELQDLQPLAALNALQTLRLGGCYQVQNLQPLVALNALQTLGLGGCYQVQNLQPLATLTALQALGLSECYQLKDLKPLASLTALQRLSLTKCYRIQDLQPLSALIRLKDIDLFGASLLDCSPGIQPLASWVNLEKLYANRLIAAPSELGSSDWFDNALPRLRGWQADLAMGEAPNSTIKLYVLGNGLVGKTQICRRLCGESFDSSIPSTHGIRLGQLRLVGASGNQPAVDADFWDFGGQDIYLGTHALFLDERAIYAIAWNPEYENIEESEQHGALLRNRPLAYWLEYVRSLAGTQAPVIVVQTRCDRELDVLSAPVPVEHEFEWLRVTSSSAKQDDGMERLQLELKSAARYQLERYGKVRLPANWVAVGEELRARSHEKTMLRTEFDELCLAKHGSAVPGVVLEYLHRSGQVFWREGLFGNQVVLDLAWALNGVYAVLERNTALPEVRCQAGRFSPRLLGALVWRDYGEAERELFLSLMEQCQICFKVAEDVYIAPALLPALETMEDAVDHVWRRSSPDTVVRLDYAFLHEGVLRAMLCVIGNQAGVHAVYWAYGVCFYDAEQKSTVRIRSTLPDAASGQTGGSIRMEIAGPGAEPLATHLVESFQQLNIGHPPNVTWELGKADQEARVETETAGASKQAFAAVNPARPPRLPGEPQPVYVSYAWGGESEALVDEFEERIPKNFTLIRDKSAMRPGDWISRFMADIGRADLVLVVLSDKYLRSVYCMRELLHLFNTSQGERDRLMQRTVPLFVGGLQCARARDRDPYVTYWEGEYTTLDALLKKRGLASVGEADRAEWLAIQDFQHRVSDMLAWVADTLMPQGTKGIDAAIELLKQRASCSARREH